MIDLSLLWPSSEESGYLGVANGLVVQRQCQRPSTTSDLPKLSPSYPSVTLSGSLGFDTSNVDGDWSFINSTNPTTDGLPGPSLHIDGLGYTNIINTSPAFENPDWIGNHFRHRTTHPHLSTGLRTPSATPATPTLHWTQHIPFSHPQYDTPLVKMEGRCPVEYPRATVEQSSDTTQDSNPQRKCAAYQASHPSPKPGMRDPSGKINDGETSSTPAPPKPPSSSPGLRTETRKAKRTKAPPRPGESLERQRARASHNIVEQQSRRRLHAGFEALLEAILEGIDLDGHDTDELASPGTRSGASKRRVSKADVLSRALRAFHFLKSDDERVRREVEQLRRLQVQNGGRECVAGAR